MGAAPFVDYRFNRFLSIGFMPELTLNVIPKTQNYPISAMLAGALRLKVEYPGLRTIVPYALLAPGYSLLFGCCTDGAASGDAHGFVASAYAGMRIPIGTRHSIFVEAGYMRGFQKNGGRDYAPATWCWPLVGRRRCSGAGRLEGIEISCALEGAIVLSNP